ncbi:ap2 domain transcription factor ap2viia-9 [Cystoisospora suis]|uniref:Ap2 domain transcription factor ap2viia-9 n=1 Tax=Cystoisospora suis TaxID=483139 RepID=A0A2C6L300_9APIC|nr:ap2 domain transcription factor ap2viia-9 [Cystoisospora suis]
MDEVRVAATPAVAVSAVIEKGTNTLPKGAHPKLHLPRLLEEQCARALVCAFFEQPRHLARLLHEADTIVEAPGLSFPLGSSLGLSEGSTRSLRLQRDSETLDQSSADRDSQRSRSAPFRASVNAFPDISQFCRRLNQGLDWNAEEPCHVKSDRVCQPTAGKETLRTDNGNARPLVPNIESEVSRAESDCCAARERVVGNCDSRTLSPGATFVEARKASNGKLPSDGHPLCWMLSEAERRFAQAERDIETQLQRVNEGVNRFADHVSGVYAVLSGLASETEEFRDHMKTRVAEWCRTKRKELRTSFAHPGVSEHIPASSEKDVLDPEKTGEASGCVTDQVRQIRDEEEACCSELSGRKQTESGEVQIGGGSQGGNRISSGHADDRSLGTLPAMRDVGMNAFPTLEGRRMIFTHTSRQHPTGGSTDGGDSLAGAGSIASSLHSRLSVPIIPRCVRRRRWWEFTRSRHTDSGSNHFRNLCSEDASRCGSSTHPRGTDSETEDEGVQFEDGTVPDDYSLHSRDFFYLSDVVSPLLHDFSSSHGFLARTCSHSDNSGCPAGQETPGRLTESNTSATGEHEATTLHAPDLRRNEDSETVERNEEEKDEGLTVLLNVGGPKLRWSPPALPRRNAGDPKPSTRSKGAAGLGGYPGPSTLDHMPCEGENSSQSRTSHIGQSPLLGWKSTHELTKFADSNPMLYPILGTSCSWGLPSLLLSHRTRRPPDPTRPRPLELGETLKSLERDISDPESGRVSRGRRQRTWSGRAGEGGGGVGRDCAGGGEDSPAPVEEKGGSLRAPWETSESLPPRQGRGSTIPGEGQDIPGGSPVTMGATMAFPYVKGVTYSRLKKYWIAQWIEDGQAKVKYFSTYKYGEELAHKLAVDWRLSRATSARSGRQRPVTACQTGPETAGAAGSVAGPQERTAPSDSQQEAGPNTDSLAATKGDAGGSSNDRSEKYSGTRRRCGTLPHARRAAARMSWLGSPEPCLGEGAPGTKSATGGQRGGGRGGAGRQLTPHRNNSIVGVSFSRTGNAWLAYIKNRLTKMQVNRYFKVTVYGFKLAKKKAIEARLELEKQLRSQSGWEAFSDRKSLSAGVYFEEDKNSWVACCRDPNTGEGLYKFFSVDACPGGDEEARTKAIDARLEMDELFGEDDEHAYAQPNTEVARRKRKRKTEDGEIGSGEGEVSSAASKEGKRDQQTHSQLEEAEKEGTEELQPSPGGSDELAQTAGEAMTEEFATKTGSEEFVAKESSQGTAGENASVESWKGLGKARRLRAPNAVGAARPKPKRKCVRGRWRRGPCDVFGSSPDEVDASEQASEAGRGPAAPGGPFELKEETDDPVTQDGAKTALESDGDGSTAGAKPGGGLIGKERVKTEEPAEVSELSWTRQDQEGSDNCDEGQACVKPEGLSEDAVDGEDSSTDRDDSCETAPPGGGECIGWGASQSLRAEKILESGWVNDNRDALESPTEELEEHENPDCDSGRAPPQPFSAAGDRS